jgi:uncharacterized protein (TIGR03437 family)
MIAALRSGVLIFLAVCPALPVFAANASYAGSFATDDDKRIFYFTLPQAGPVNLRTWSYAGGVNAAGTTVPAGGFDPTISLFDSQGNFIVHNRDGGCGNVAPDPATSFCWDSFLSLTLPAGSYSVVLTQSENLPNAPRLSDSFVYDGQANFTTPAGAGSPGFWDLFPNKRTSAYALDIVGAASAATTITSSSQLPFGVAGASYSPFIFTAQSGAATLTWSVVAGSLPPGLTLNATSGVLSGIAQSSGTFAFTVQVTDGVQPVTQSVSVTILAALRITTSLLPAGAAGQPYGPVNLIASGGSGSFSWRADGLPANLTMSATGAIAGTPLAGGSFPLQISVSDPVSGLSASTSLTLSIAVAPLVISSSGSLGGFVPGASISGTFRATGGQTPYTWSATGLPGGLSLNSSTGAFSGTAGSPGVYSFTVRVSDAASTTASATLNVTYSVLGINTSALPGGSTTAVYSASFSAIGGTPPYSFSATGLPQGLSLSGSGAITGTPRAAGTFTLRVQVTDSAGLSTSSQFALEVTGVASPLTISGGPLPGGNAGAAYSSNLQASGGTAPYLWSVFGGALPGGISLSNSGAVQGTPDRAGDYSFTAHATDAAGATATGVFTLTISPATLTISLGTFPIGIAGSDYPVQILSASGGVAPYSFTIGSGSLPPGLILAGGQISGLSTTAGSFGMSITVTDSAGKTTAVNGSITINPAHTDLILSQSTVSFSLTAGAGGVPTPASVTVRSSAVQQLLNYSFRVSPAASWLSVTGGNSTPGSLSIAIDPSAPSLPASTANYLTAIVVSCIAPSPCAGAVQTINVALAVSVPPPQLSLGTGLLSFSALSSNPAPSSQSLGLQDTGGGAIAITSITTADSWLSVSGTPSTLTAGPAKPMTVTANPAGLSPGYFRSTITVNSSAGSATVPVTLLIAQAPAMTLGPSGAQFSTPAGSSPGNSGGTFNVSVTGGAANWSAVALPGANWLTVGSSSGSSNAAAAGTVSYSLDPALIAALEPATYYANIQVTSTDVADSPQNFLVVLNVTAAAAPVKPALSTAGLIFTSSAVAGATPAQTVAVFSSASLPVPYQASATTSDGAAWLTVSPATGSASSSATGSSSVSVNVTGLAPGVYSGGVSYAFSSEAVRTVNVTLLILKAGTVPSLREPASLSATATTCVATRTIATQTGLFNNFAQPAGWPTPLSIKLINDCGAAVPGAQVTTTFSNGDAPLTLTQRDSSSGVYLGTWTPQGVSPQVTVIATAIGSPFAAATSKVTGEVRSNSVPILTKNGTLDVFNALVGAALAPGEVVQIYGTNLATQVATATGTPLPASLAGTSVLIGGIPAPLFYVGPGQINAEVPFELIPGMGYQLQVNVNGALSTPGPIQIVTAAPGLAASSGQIIAQHAADYSLVSEASPARPGEYIILYLAGLGATDNAVATGAAAPSNPLSRTLAAPVLTLNGSAVPIAFAGLTPSAVGLYQIDFQLPANTPNGDLTLSVTQAAATSNVTILPVHQ